MVFTTFWFEHQVFGERAAGGYHFDNVALHAIASVLLWRVLAALEVPAAFVAACVFAVHPINVESVAWITERKNVLSAVFYFASALTFLRGRFAASVVLLAGALLSKSVTCSLPAALLLVLWWKHRTPTRREALTLAIMFAIALVMAAMTAILERTHVQAVGREWDLSAADRILVAGRAIWFYATTIVLPFNLSFIYPKWPIDAAQVWQWAFPLGVIAAIFSLWRMRDRWGRGPLVATLIFAGTLVPALGFFNIFPMRYTFVADHYAYHASAALLVLIGIGLQRLLGPRGVYVVVVPLVFLTLVRCTTYANLETLWRDTVQKNPGSWMTHLNLARALDGADKTDEAADHFAAAVQLGSDVVDTHLDYGTFLSNHDQFDRAVAQYNRAMEIAPELPQIYLKLARTYRKMNRIDDANRAYTEAVRRDPSLATRPQGP
jgi:tetratricopeptide (TPR) repeat protein